MRKIVFTGCILFIFLSSAGWADVPRYTVMRATGKIVIDGLLDDPCWAAARQVGDFVFPWWTAGDKELTGVKMLWDDNFLYAAFSCKDTHIWADHFDTNSATCLDDCVEIFFNPDPKAGDAYNMFEMNCIGNVLAVCNNRKIPVLENKILPPHIAQRIEGTLNNDTDTDTGWVLEVAIRFSDYPGLFTGKTPKDGDVWRVGLNRCGGKTNEQFSQWSASQTPKPNFHSPKDFGKVIFSGKPVFIQRPVTSAENIAGIRMVPIPGGSFQMGSNWEDDPNNPLRGKGYFHTDKPTHTVTVSAFQMSATEVTQGQYKTITGTNPSAHTGDDDLPVEMVSWRDAVRFCNLLSDRSGLRRCYDERGDACDFTKDGFRLPTEAEWEYACRAGTVTRYYSGENEVDLGPVAWYSVTSGERNLAAVKLDMKILEESHCCSHIVGRKTPNGWGLYDILGNVYEWCNDWYAPYTAEAQTDPKGPRSGVIRMIRGGGWGSYANRCTVFGRSGYKPESRNSFTGFRVVHR